MILNHLSMMASEAVAINVLAICLTNAHVPLQMQVYDNSWRCVPHGLCLASCCKEVCGPAGGGAHLLGVGVGFAEQSVTIYKAEMAPPQWRGLLHILFQPTTVTGNGGYRTSFLVVTILTDSSGMHFVW